MYKEYFFGASGFRSVVHLVVRWDACRAPKFMYSWPEVLTGPEPMGTDVQEAFVRNVSFSQWKYRN